MDKVNHTPHNAHTHPHQMFQSQRSHWQEPETEEQAGTSAVMFFGLKPSFTQHLCTADRCKHMHNCLHKRSPRNHNLLQIIALTITVTLLSKLFYFFYPYFVIPENQTNLFSAGGHEGG